MFTPRTSPVKEGTKPYAWGIDSQYECTWFCYFRCQEAMTVSPPCFYEGHGSSGYGSYTDAKDWLECYRDPWIPITDPNYKPVAGDILVYDGEHGHVIFMETDTMTSEYRKGDPNSFRNAKLGDYKGKLLGVLHYPYQPINPVERNENVTQIETTDSTLRIRTKPGLDGEIVGHVQLGYYNVLSIVEATEEDKMREPQLKCWYEIAKGKYIANVTTIYHEAMDDPIQQIERYFDGLKKTIVALGNENKEMRADMEKINEIVKRWSI